jgi:hypothetical protein
MVAGLSIALIMAAPAAAAAQPPAATKADSPAAAASAEACPAPGADGRTIVICTQRPQGYRLNPDVMEARREIRSGGRPVRPGGKVVPDCATVGPFPCTSAGINLIGAALTAAEIAKRLAKGEEVGSMFLTDPHPTEYQLYLMAKAKREAEQAEAAAATVAKAANANPADHGERVPVPAGNYK